MPAQPSVSVIIPIYNEGHAIAECLSSLAHQQGVSWELLIVDDGSQDQSLVQARTWSESLPVPTTILQQSHLGPGKARNVAAAQAKGKILVFVDADMTFTPEFLARLVAPITAGESKGTFTKEEYVSNWDTVWARCWNYQQGIPDKRRVPRDFPDTAPVFRAILTEEFLRVGGFDPIGYTDDWTLSRKLGYQATAARGAVCYHRNPETLADVYDHARWIGKNEFMTGSMIRRLYNTVRYFPLVQLGLGVVDGIRFATPAMPVFRLVYGTAVWISVLFSWDGKGYHA